MSKLRHWLVDERGMISVEYILILSLVVIPLIMLEPLWMRMIVTYNFRILRIIGLPFL